MLWLRWFVLGIVWLLVLSTVLIVCGRWRWAGLTAQLLARLESMQAPLQPARFDLRELAGLPPPVQRYFRTALTDGMPLVSAVSIDHAGTFNTGETTDRWKPFTSTQRVITRRPGFLWDGRIAMLPGLYVHVHDAYVAGEGILHPTIAGLVTLIDLRGGNDLAQGELMRFFAEAAWYPTALLPSQGIHWEAVDEDHARATLTDGPISLTLTFSFSADGLIESIFTEARGRTVSGKIVSTPWEGRWSNYKIQHGMRVPMTGEVAWLLPEGRKHYWRGCIMNLNYEFGQ